MDWNEFISMGGHGFYVWTSWGLCLLAVLIVFIHAKRRNASIRHRLIRQINRQEKFES